jgi:hypothetical protein
MTGAQEDMPSLASQMRTAANELVESLTDQQRLQVLGPFRREEQTQWTYLPGDRPGLLVRELSSEQRDLAAALLSTSYSPRGARDAELVVHTEAIRSGQPLDPAASSVLTSYADPVYYLRLLGDPGSRGEPWLWRLSGHHLVAQATVVGDEVSSTPQFFGTQPARVASGPHTGFRGLPREEDLARRLVQLLDEEQRGSAVLSPRAPADIQSRDDPIATVPSSPPGLRHARMTTEQRALFEELIAQYVNRAAPPLANRAWDDLRRASIDEVAFAWAGGLSVGDGHYYAVTGPTLLLEYDNTQEDANHVHSVWRDLRHDWGGDQLGAHYRDHEHRVHTPFAD